MKSSDRERLLYLKKYIKLSTLASEFGLQQSRLSLFMNGSDGIVSSDLIHQFVEYVESTVSDIIA